MSNTLLATHKNNAAIKSAGSIFDNIERLNASAIKNTARLSALKENVVTEIGNSVWNAPIFAEISQLLSVEAGTVAKFASLKAQLIELKGDLLVESFKTEVQETIDNI